MPSGIDFASAEEYSGFLQAGEMEHPEFEYDSLIRPLESRMMRSIWRIVREREAAEDALQDALAVIWRKRGTVARHPNPEALILRIAISAAWDGLRKSRRRRLREITGLAELPAPSAGTPVENAATEAEFRDAVLAAIALLPRRQAEAVLLRVIEEQSFEKIALAMGCSEPTARIHVMRGKAALARRLAEWRPRGGPRANEDGEKEA